MNKSRRFPLMGLLLFVSGVSGCADGGAVAFRQYEPHNFSPLLAATAAVQRSAIDDVESNPAPTTQTSTDSSRPTAQRSLITLPRGGDLSEHINEADGSVLLDFFADWCGPCRAQGRILHDIADTAAETQTLIIKINIDEHPQLAKEFQVSSLPTLMIMKDGKIVRRQSGVANNNRLVNWMR